jgi:hypothetical protein
MSKKTGILILCALLITMGNSCTSPNDGITDQNPAPPDTEAPTASGIISVGTSTCRTVPITWAQASDNTTKSSDLEYTVYVSPINAMPTLNDAVTNGTRVMDWIASKTTALATELIPGTAYHIAVFARDTAGNVSGYPDASATTKSGIAITWCSYLFPTSFTAKTNTATQAYGRYYIDGITTKSTMFSAIRVELGYYRSGESPDTAKYAEAQFAGQSGNNHEYNCSLSFPSAGTYKYFYRFSGDEGYSWSKADEGTATISN